MKKYLEGIVLLGIIDVISFGLTCFGPNFAVSMLARGILYPAVFLTVYFIVLAGGERKKNR